MEGQQDGQELEHSSYEEKERNQDRLILGQRWLQEYLTAALQHLWEGQQGDGGGLFTAGHGDRIR